MVAYEDLVVALTNWRINQGLPTGSDAFAAFETGSVDLALPVADPVELSTSEVLAVDDDAAIEDILDEQQVEASAPGDDVESFDAYADDAAAGLDYDAAPHDAAPHEASLDYAEETAYGEIPQMDEPMDEVAAAPEPLAEADEAQSMASENGEPSYEPEPLADPRTEEVDALEMESEIDADGLEAVEAAADAQEEFVADDMAVEEEIDADGLEAVEAAADDFDPDEMPTRFGDDEGEESEATVMGIGINELRPADES